MIATMTEPARIAQGSQVGGRDVAGSGTATYTFTNAGATAIAVFVQHGKGGEPSISVSWGNRALTKVAVEAPGVGGSTEPAVQVLGIAKFR